MYDVQPRNIFLRYTYKNVRMSALKRVSVKQQPETCYLVINSAGGLWARGDGDPGGEERMDGDVLPFYPAWGVTNA